MLHSSHTIFTIQTDKNCKEEIVQIETVITNGLYRFTLLGMQTKIASDTKDRVYSALRSSNLLNLKSDNRKIIVNLSPDETDKKEGIYDLGIALSLLSCIDKQMTKIEYIALGGLSITGKITPSKRIKQGIYTAYKNNIKYIMCSEEDEGSLTYEDVRMLKSCDIHIISAVTLRDIAERLKMLEKAEVEHKRYKWHKEKGEGYVTKEENGEVVQKIDFNTLDTVSRGLLIGLSGGHHVLFEATLSRDMKDVCDIVKNMKHEGELLGRSIYGAFQEKLLDKERIPQNTYIENIKCVSKNEVMSYQTSHRNSILALYSPCSCGHQHVFFNTNTSDRRCICSKRLMLQHKRHIESTYFDLFTLRIENTSPSVELPQNFEKSIESIRKIQFDRYIKENNLENKDIFLFPDNSYLNQYRNIEKIAPIMNEEASEFWKEQKYDAELLRVAQTIQDCIDYSENNATKKPTLSKQALVLAISYMPKMDF